MLWLKGKPGAGKSTLMKTALHRTGRKHGQKFIIASFFFNARGNELERNPNGLYRSILHQIVKQDATILNWFHNIYEAKRDSMRTRWEWAEEELESLLRDALSVTRTKPICLFVDALDECEASKARDLVYYFRMLTDMAYASGQTLKICLSSRHYPTITLDRCPEIVVEDTNSNDIQVYVRSTLHSQQLIHGPFVIDLQDTIIRQASGIFLWVVLVVGIVSRVLDEGKGPQEIHNILRKVPRDLDLLFTDILNGVNEEEQERSLALVRWVLFAHKELSIDSIYLAITFSTESPYKSIGQWPQIYQNRTHPQQITRLIRNLSKGLIEVSWSGVQFIHEAVRSFFVHGKGLAILENRLTSPSAILGHLTIIRGCLHHTYLEELLPTIRPLIPDPSPEASKWAFARSNCYWFSLYAASYLSRHVNMPEFTGIVPEGFQELLGKIMQRLQRAWSFGDLGIEVGISAFRVVPWEPDLFTLTEEALNFTHRLITELTLADFTYVNLHTSQESCSASLCRNLQQYVATKPKQEPSLGLPSWTSLHRRSCFPHEAKSSIDWEACDQIHSTDSRGRTPIHIAVLQGNVAFAKTLLSYGADPTVGDASSHTPLHLAARIQDVEMCNLLLKDSRINLHARNIVGCTPLHCAVLSSSIQIIRVLLSAGHDINAQTCYGRTPIQIAVECGDDRMVRFLNEAGAIPTIVDGQNMSALSIQEQHSDRFLGMTKSLNPRVTGGNSTNPQKMLASAMGHRPPKSASHISSHTNSTFVNYTAASITSPTHSDPVFLDSSMTRNSPQGEYIPNEEPLAHESWAHSIEIESWEPETSISRPHRETQEFYTPPSSPALPKRYPGWI